MVVRIPNVLLILLSLSLLACGRGATPIGPDSSCEANSAVIEVGDGFLRTRCGCSEGSLVLTTSGTNLKCTVRHGTTVFFSYLGATLKHQIISTAPEGSASSFTSSAIWAPKASFSAHGYLFSKAGSYPYSDAFSSQLNGTIIAN